jgi:hypothetical protein
MMVVSHVKGQLNVRMSPRLVKGVGELKVAFNFTEAMHPKALFQTMVFVYQFTEKSPDATRSVPRTASKN